MLWRMYTHVFLAEPRFFWVPEATLGLARTRWNFDRLRKLAFDRRSSDNSATKGPSHDQPTDVVISDLSQCDMATSVELVTVVKR